MQGRLDQDQMPATPLRAAPLTIAYEDTPAPQAAYRDVPGTPFSLATPMAGWEIN